jgi:hypothetical protein
MVPVGEVNNGGGFQPCPEQIHQGGRLRLRLRLSRLRTR